MKQTELVYMSHMDLLTCEAIVLDVQQKNEKVVVVLNRTVFYPQGGGQPYDTGTISSQTGEMVVEEVRYVDGFVHHIGVQTGKIEVSQTIQCKVDAKRRKLNSRNHSAGHVIDMAIVSLGLGWTAVKGFHFPEGPYIEYRGLLDQNTAEVKDGIEKGANKSITNTSTRVAFMDQEKMREINLNVPEYLPKGKPTRVVFYKDFGVPCGGTHVQNLKEIGLISIRKLKVKKDIIRVSYSISSELD